MMVAGLKEHLASTAGRGLPRPVFDGAGKFHEVISNGGVYVYVAMFASVPTITDFVADSHTRASK